MRQNGGLVMDYRLGSNPCNGCKPPKRHIGCHGDCYEYAEWSNLRQEYLHNRNKEDQLAMSLNTGVRKDLGINLKNRAVNEPESVADIIKIGD